MQGWSVFSRTARCPRTVVTTVRSFGLHASNISLSSGSFKEQSRPVVGCETEEFEMIRIFQGMAS